MSSTTLKKENSYSRDSLHSYQNRIVDFVKTNTHGALWVDMGLGKSVSVLTALSDLFSTNDVGKALIIAPPHVAKNTWPHEILKWAHTQHLDFDLLVGSPAEREEKINGPDQIHIISVDLLVWLVRTVKTAWPYDTVIIDESSTFKSSKSQRWKYFRKVLPYIDRLIQLTGTPTSNGLLDLWPQIYLLDQGKRLGKTFGSYKEAYFDSDFKEFNFWPRKTEGFDAEKVIHDKLSDICLTLSANDYLNMPDRVERVVDIELPTHARSQYQELERHLLLEIESDTIVAPNAAVLTSKLLQFCNGAIYTTEEKTVQHVHDKKMEALDTIVESSNEEPLLVAYNFRSELDRIREKYPFAVHISDSPNTVNRWNRGQIKMLLAHPKSAGHGLNLQQGGCTVVWFGLNWSLELYQQFNARLYRQGQEKPVVIYHLVVTDSIDETVMESLKHKNATQRSLLNALKRDLKSRVN